MEIVWKYMWHTLLQGPGGPRAQQVYIGSRPIINLNTFHLHGCEGRGLLYFKSVCWTLCHLRWSLVIISLYVKWTRLCEVWPNVVNFNMTTFYGIIMNQITPEDVKSLSDEEWASLGVTSIGTRVRIRQQCHSAGIINIPHQFCNHSLQCSASTSA